MEAPALGTGRPDEAARLATTATEIEIRDKPYLRPPKLLHERHSKIPSNRNHGVLDQIQWRLFSI